jgi:PAS domain S-box-containing protein
VLHTRVAGRSRSFLALDQPLPDYGWTLTVMTDRDEILQVRDQAWAMAALAMALLVMGGLYWRLRERRYAEQRSARRELEQRVADRTRELQEAQAFRHAMEESLLVGMRARDLDGTIIYVNRALCQMTGYEPEELLGHRPPYPYWHPDDLEKHWRDSDASLAGQAEPSGFESRVRHKAGHDVITMVYTAPLIDADGVQRGWMSSVVDITEQKRAEERQRAGRPAAARGPPGQPGRDGLHPGPRAQPAADGAVQLRRGGPGPGPGRPAGPAGAEPAGRAGPGPAGLGDRAPHPRHGAPGQRPGRALRRGRAGGHRAGLAQARDHRPARAHRSGPAADLPPVLADRVLAEQLLLNLVLNALQALEGQPPERRRIEIGARVDGARLLFSVADQGPGVAAEHAEQLFAPSSPPRPRAWVWA